MLKKRPETRIDLSAGQQAPIALICDEMTWQNLRREQPVVYLDPFSWRDILNKYKPGVFLCEAAWEPPWRGQIYKDRRVRYENRRLLFKILDFCKSLGIRTAFWAKEDPAYFQDDRYDFTDTALHFDDILTTAAECVPGYLALGHKSVHLWPFGFSSTIFNPPDKSKESRERVAVFAGSWYTDQPQRCNDLSALFDMVLSKGISLRIYNRRQVSGHSVKPYPERYRQYILDAVDYESLGDIYRKAQYAINVNTVRDSGTMFARRVYEAMACGCIVISNGSQGLREQFGSRIWYNDEPFDHMREDEIRQENILEVFDKHTWTIRVRQLLEIIESE
jgi:hypothetical protein